ncbi:MAG: SMP-30/gluconolactonase/LRE family protein [Deltaproteobacteria bacterium]|nr:SMP-30/gluconolactonase/LRE family protein [Deltaproteobacteria bacterium]
MPTTQKNGFKIDCVLKCRAILGESPLWDPDERVLYWVDIEGHNVHRFHPGSGLNDTFHLDQIVSSVALRDQGGLIITLKDRFAFFNPDTGDLNLLEGPRLDMSECRFNDGKCDRQGRFWAGTMSLVQHDAPSGHLFRFDPDGHITTILSQVRLSNGLGWSPDNRVMYFAESFRHCIHAFDFDPAEGVVTNQRVFATVDENSPGVPDGLTVDAEGCVWSAQPGLGQVVRYSPTGKVECVVELPVPRPTSCIFGGENLEILYVTSATEMLTAEQLAQAPLSGGIFAMVPGVRGLPEPRFAG